MITKLLKNAMISLTGYRTKLALVVRDDLKMTKGKTAAQCAHAAVLCYSQAQKTLEQQKILNSWCATGQPKIVLRAGYEEVMELQRRASEMGVNCAIVRDAGHTQLQPGTTTVLGLGPDRVEQIDKLVAHLKLL